MRQDIFQKRVMIVFLSIILISLLWMGCSSTVKERRAEPAKGEGESVGQYYHFEDVRVPRELNYRQNKSFIYETPRFKTGILVFSKWRLDVESLIDFFTYNMEKNN